ncbi:hypothetical protein D3C76_358160 [compost metagenome]
MTSQCRISAEQRAVLLTQDRAKRVYIAGPMTGIEDFNFPAFNAMADNMRAGGWHVENPADHGVVHGAEWADYLRYDVGRLATCEAIMLLPGWSKSKGANLEVTIARQLGMPIMLAEGAEPAPQPHPEPIAWMVGTAFWWTKEEAERDAAATGLPVVPVGPLTGSAEVEQLREVFKHSDAQIMRQSLRISNQRAQLAERDALLERVVKHAEFWRDHPCAEVVEGIAKEYKALSASPEPIEPVMAEDKA